MFLEFGRDVRPRDAAQATAASQCMSLRAVRIKPRCTIATIEENGHSFLGRHANSRTLRARIRASSHAQSTRRERFTRPRCDRQPRKANDMDNKATTGKITLGELSVGSKSGDNIIVVAMAR